MPFTYNYARPALGTDILLFHKEKQAIEVLLIQRKHEPFAQCWAFPGGFVEENESCEQAALRELQEETGIPQLPITQLYTFSRPDRDPRGWIVTVAFWAWVDKTALRPFAGDDAQHLAWFNLEELPKLAFDHQEIMDKALALLPELKSLD